MKVLKIEEERRLFTILENKNESDDEKQKARNKLILSNMGIAIKIATFYKPKFISLDLNDIISNAVYCLILAVDRYRLNKNSNFYHYAYNCIRLEIIHILVNEVRMIKLPEFQHSNCKDFKLNSHCIDNFDLSSEEIKNDEHDENQKRLNIIYNHLSEEFVVILKMYYGIGYTKPIKVRQIAKQFKLHPETIRRKKRKIDRLLKGI